VSTETSSIRVDAGNAGLTEQTYPIDSRRNSFAFAGDILFFVLAMYFIPPTTVLVGLASRLTDDKVLIGAVGTAWAAMWYLPQLFGAQLVRGKRWQKKYIVIPAVIGRQLFILFAGWLWFTKAEQPLLTVWLLLLVIGVFNIFDASASVAWFDTLARAMTPRRRGRVIVTAQMTASIIGLGAGVIIERLLGPSGLPFPQNYALVIFFAWVLMTISLFSFLTMKEVPMSESAADHGNNVSILKSLSDNIKSDPLFRRVLISRLLTGFEAMGASFYLVFAKEQLNMGESAVGIFTLALTIGAILGLVLFGWLSERFGPRRVVHASTTFQCIAPLLAFLVALFPDWALQWPTAALITFMVVMALRGAIEHSLVLGYIGYVMDAAPEQHRPVYVGTMNTIGGVVALAPVIGGVVIAELSGFTGGMAAYAVVFATTALLVGLGWWLGLSLPKLTTHQG